MLYFLFMSFILMYGHLQFKVIVELITMSFFLINLLTLFGCILLERNLKSYLNFFTFVLILKINSIRTYKHFSVIMAKNMTILISIDCVTLMAFTCDFHVLTPLNKMRNPNACYTPWIMPFAPFCFMLGFLQHSRLNLFIWLLTFFISFLLSLFTMSPLLQNL